MAAADQEEEAGQEAMRCAIGCADRAATSVAAGTGRGPEATTAQPGNWRAGKLAITACRPGTTIGENVERKAGAAGLVVGDRLVAVAACRQLGGAAGSGDKWQ